MERTIIKEALNKIEQEVLLKGWIHVRRDMGKISFIDLRDLSGFLQIVLVPNGLDKTSAELVKKLRPEFVVEIQGVVQKRSARQINKEMPTGEIEVLARSLKIINEAETPPFALDQDTAKVNEELRLEYRYLDLRTQRMRKNIKIRHEAMQFVRAYLRDKDFTEIQTPILTKTTPEGARDYLVPSRVHPGKFFALPQSPQQYKQMLMVAGVERYFQIAPCFRDEDARANRSPGEFYQIDMEMSFMSQDEILQLVEEMFTAMVHKLWPHKKFTQEPWPKIPYDETMSTYKSDKPDLRQNKQDPDELAFVWVVDFPLFAKQTKEDYFHGAGKNLAPSHHMFTMPKEKDIPLLDSEPLKVRSYQHDLVLNGEEVGGGSIRIHDPALQEKIFELIGFDEKQKNKFSHLLRAFRYGVPPHGGIAPGFDRLLATILGEKNLKEVIAFPLSGEARDLLMGAPSEVEVNQLKELHISCKV